MFYVVIRGGGHSARRLGVRGSIVLLGSGEDCPLRLVGPQVAAHHARIEEDRGHHVVVALDPSHPLRVNGEVVMRHVLRAGDRIAIGDFEIEYQPASRVQTRWRREGARVGGCLAWLLAGIFIVLQMLVLGVLNYLYLSSVAGP